jgi:hypothetical protein
MAINPVRLSLSDEDAIHMFASADLEAHRSFADLSVLRAEAIDFDGRREHTRALLSRIVFHTPPDVGEWSADLIRQWAELKGILDHVNSGGEDIDVTELVRRFAEDCPQQVVKNDVAIALDAFARFDQMTRYKGPGQVKPTVP